MCMNNWRIWHHNGSASRLHDVTDQLWWCHNVNSEKTILSVSGEMDDRWLFVTEWCSQDLKQRVRNKIIHSLPWITIFGHSWGDLPMIFTHDFVTRENHWQITSLVTKKIVIHGNSCIILYIFIISLWNCSQLKASLMIVNNDAWWHQAITWTNVDQNAIWHHWTTTI